MKLKNKMVLLQEFANNIELERKQTKINKKRTPEKLTTDSLLES